MLRLPPVSSLGAGPSPDPDPVISASGRSSRGGTSRHPPPPPPRPGVLLTESALAPPTPVALGRQSQQRSRPRPPLDSPPPVFLFLVFYLFMCLGIIIIICLFLAGVFLALALRARHRGPSRFSASCQAELAVPAAINLPSTLPRKRAPPMQRCRHASEPETSDGPGDSDFGDGQGGEGGREKYAHRPIAARLLCVWLFGCCCFFFPCPPDSIVFRLQPATRSLGTRTRHSYSARRPPRSTAEPCLFALAPGLLPWRSAAMTQTHARATKPWVHAGCFVIFRLSVSGSPAP